MTDMNSRTVSLLQSMSQLISASGLPPCVVGLVLDKLRSQVEALEAKAILAERKAQEEAKARQSEGSQEGDL